MAYETKAGYVTEAEVYTQLISNIITNDDGCWLWQGPYLPNGYGRTTRYQYEQKVHRVSFILFKGDIPAGMVIRHTCDIKHCCNPEHLLLGTDSDNKRDAVERGLLTPPIGRALKITNEQVIKIRELHATGEYTITDLALQFYISRRQINRILTGVRDVSSY